MRILLVEDSDRLSRSISAALKKSGYVADRTCDGREGLWLAESNDYDVIVLDIMLPGLDGLSLLQQLRQQGKTTHVLLLTAKDTVEDRVRGLQLGADDYLIKPFALEELLARVEALCRRSYGSKKPRLAIADLEIDTITKEVFRATQPVRLKPREYLLLEYLARRAGQVVTRSEIEAHIYDDKVDPMSNVVESAICSLRKHLSAANPAPLILTRHGLGYTLKAESE
ncbi:MAG TPA: response regulator transcription factor [Candidatus Saccharimonadales bacterium]|nr:response regulator transcription factor [Candidatus Saccharimonadales bacterium]